MSCINISMQDMLPSRIHSLSKVGAIFFVVQKRSIFVQNQATDRPIWVYSARSTSNDRRSLLSKWLLVCRQYFRMISCWAASRLGSTNQEAFPCAITLFGYLLLVLDVAFTMRHVRILSSNRANLKNRGLPAASMQAMWVPWIPNKFSTSHRNIRKEMPQLHCLSQIAK